MKELNTKEFNEKTSEEKIEMLDDMISKNEKKIETREEVNKFLSLWLKVYLSIPILTLVGLIVSSAISATVVEALFPYFLSFGRLSFAVFGTSLIVVPTKLIVSKKIKNFKKENENIKEIRNSLQKQLDLSISKDNRTALEVIQDGMDKLHLNGKKSSLEVCRDGMKKMDNIEITPQKDSLDDVSPELLYQPSCFEQDELQQKQTGPRIVKKLIQQDNNKNKQD